MTEDIMQENILFIGGAGFIGSALIRTFLKNNKDTRIIVLEPSYANVSRLDGMNVNIIRCELNDIETIEQIISSQKISIVIHLVSTLIPGSNYEDYKNEILNVAFPTLRLTQLCSKHKIKFVYFSSGGTVYGQRTIPIPFIESDKREPISYYGLTKLMLENNILFEHRTQGLQYLIIRPSNPYGHGQNLQGKQGFIAVALGKILSGKSIEVWGDGNSIRDYIYIDDLANSFYQLLAKNIYNTEINIGSGKGYSVNEIIKILKSIVKEPINVNYKSARNTDVSTMILSTNKIQSVIDLKLTPIEDGIRKFYDKEKEQIKQESLPFLSICIPTFQRIEITRKTIASIYADLQGVDMNDFEVIISDNDKSGSSRCFEIEFPYNNFHYYQTDCEGFLNSYHVLNYGKGTFLKLHNNYTQLKSGTLKYMIEEIKNYLETKPLIFHTNGLRNINDKKEYKDFNQFMLDLSYFSSWSTGFGIWKDDYNKIKNNIVINNWFPQTSMLLPFYNKDLFVLNDKEIFIDQKVYKKGGYNPYRVFGVDYLSLIKNCLDKGHLSKNVFEQIKKDLLQEYLSSRFFKTVIAKMDNFEHSNIKSHLSIHYGKYSYLKLIFFALLSPFRYLIRKIF